MGVKKSTVCTRARSGATRNTPASSAVEVPTSRSACTTGGSARRMSERSAGPSLPAQPAARARSVSRKSSARVRAPLSPSAMRGTLSAGSAGVQSTAARAEVADADGHAGPVAPVEERAGDLPARIDRVTERRGGDGAVLAAVRRDDRLRVLGSRAGIVEVPRDADHPTLGFEDAEDLREPSTRHAGRLLQLAEIGRR